MLKRFDIAQFGTFKDFSWTSVVDDEGNIKEFAEFNVLYGRNYTGKTTLSRIARFLETSALPPRYNGTQFAIATNSGTINHTDPVPADVHVRVYNKDFVNEHLRFLRDDDGEIRPIAILGKNNKEVTEDIEKLQLELGKEDVPGLLKDLANANEVVAAAIRKHAAAKQAVVKSMTSKANDKPNGMKHNDRFGDRYYDVGKLRHDLETVVKNNIVPLDPKRRREVEAQCDAKALETPTRLIGFQGKFLELTRKARELAISEIRPTKAIEYLLNDAALHRWVKDGIGLHEGRRSTCGFCNQNLPHDIWDTLRAHYNKESEYLESAIDQCLVQIGSEVELVANLGNVNIAEVYDSLKPQLSTALTSLRAACTEYRNNLDILSASLQKRKSDIFCALPAPSARDVTSSIETAISAVNRVIADHSAKSKTLSEDKTSAGRELRLSEVAEYTKELHPLKERENEASRLQLEAEKKRDQIQLRVQDIGERITTLQGQLKDEGLGAQRVNKYLKSSFGNIDLELIAEQDAEKKYTFRVCRGTETAYNMSEGECSLLSFCYFLAKLDDVESDGKSLIVWIDDPISSLDANHVFFVHGLIESRLARPIGKDPNGGNLYRYRQIFLATHSLEFLRYMRRLSRPNKESRVGFFVVVRTEGGSAIRVMQPHLRNYVTEFHYLFSEIAICATPGAELTHPYSFYSFGNHLRRFLEAFLFYKYPFSGNLNKTDEDFSKRVGMFFSSETGEDATISRMMNEQSHTMGALEMVAEPVDNAQISRIARHVLKRMKINDGSQYTYLIECTGKADPLAGIA